MLGAAHCSLAIHWWPVSACDIRAEGIYLDVEYMHGKVWCPLTAVNGSIPLIACTRCGLVRCVQVSRRAWMVLQLFVS
jgi:hypothetical protein